MFDCDPPISGASSGSGSGASGAAAMKTAAINTAKIVKALSAVSYTLFACGATILTLAAFLEPSKVGIPIIIGYSFILAGIAAFAALVILAMLHPPTTTTYATVDKIRVGMMFFSLILLASISLSMYSKYKSEIKSGHVPQFSTFSALISLFICMQLYEMYKWVATNKDGVFKITSTLNSTLLLYKLITYLLIICLTISLKYYITDG